MSQSTARHDPLAKSGDDDVDDIQARQSRGKQGVRSHPSASHLADDGGAGLDEPDEGEFELVGGDDLSDIDLGPASPNFTDPDAPSGRLRKITPDTGRRSGD